MINKDLTKKDILKIILKTHALLTVDEGFALYNLAKQCNGDILEIGSYKGGSTIIMALGLKDPYKVYAIDPHNYGDYLKNIGEEIVPKSSLDIFFDNIKKYNVKDNIVPMVNTAENISKRWKKPISLLFIDGDHNYLEVKRDYLNFESFVKKGGLICIHDSECSDKIMPIVNTIANGVDGPIKFKKDIIIGSKNLKILKTVDTLTITKKIKNNKFEIIKNLLILKIQTSVNEYKEKNYSKPNFFNYIIFKLISRTDYLIGKIGKLIK